MNHHLLLPAAGALAGGGAGGILGRILAPLDYPRQAAANLVTPWTGKWGQADENGEHSLVGGSSEGMLPGLLGLAAGGVSALTPAAPLAPLIGTGVAGALQGLMGDEAPGVDEVTSRAGMGDSTLARMLVGMATDPMTWAGAAGGGVAGSRVGGAMEGLDAMRGESTAYQAAHAAKQADVVTAQRLKQAAEKGMLAFDQPGAHNAVPEAMKAVPELLDQGPHMQYRDDLLKAMPSSSDLADANMKGPRGGKAPGGKSYKVADPQMASDLEGLGWGSREGKGMKLHTASPPVFAEGRGGRLMPTAQRQKMLGGGTPSGDVLSIAGGSSPTAWTGPRVPSSPEGFLAGDPIGEASRSAELSNDILARQRFPHRKIPTLAEMLGGSADELYDSTKGVGRITSDEFPQEMLGQSRTLSGHIMGLPVDQALEQAGLRAKEVQAALAELEAARPGEGTTSGLQKLLLRMGY